MSYLKSIERRALFLLSVSSLVVFLKEGKHGALYSILYWDLTWGRIIPMRFSIGCPAFSPGSQLKKPQPNGRTARCSLTSPTLTFSWEGLVHINPTGIIQTEVWRKLLVGPNRLLVDLHQALPLSLIPQSLQMKIEQRFQSCLGKEYVFKLLHKILYETLKQIQVPSKFQFDFYTDDMSIAVGFFYYVHE